MAVALLDLRIFRPGDLAYDLDVTTGYFMMSRDVVCHRLQRHRDCYAYA